MSGRDRETDSRPLSGHRQGFESFFSVHPLVASPLTGPPQRGTFLTGSERGSTKHTEVASLPKVSPNLCPFLLLARVFVSEPRERERESKEYFIHISQPRSFSNFKLAYSFPTSSFTPRNNFSDNDRLFRYFAFDYTCDLEKKNCNITQRNLEGNESLIEDTSPSRLSSLPVTPKDSGQKFRGRGGLRGSSGIIPGVYDMPRTNNNLVGVSSLHPLLGEKSPLLTPPPFAPRYTPFSPTTLYK